MKLYRRDSDSNCWIGSDGVFYVLDQTKGQLKLTSFHDGVSVSRKDSVRIHTGVVQDGDHTDLVTLVARRHSDNVLSIGKKTFDKWNPQGCFKDVIWYVRDWVNKSPCRFEFTHSDAGRAYFRPVECCGSVFPSPPLSDDRRAK